MSQPPGLPVNPQSLVSAISQELRVSINRVNQEKILRHDFTDPFATTSCKLGDQGFSSQSTYLILHGNAVRTSGMRRWIIDGEVAQIDAGFNNKYMPAGAAGKREPLLQKIVSAFEALGYKTASSMLISGGGSIRKRSLAENEIHISMTATGDLPYYVISSLRWGINGERVCEQQRFDSLGYDGIAKAIHNGWRKLDAIAPKSKSEAEERKRDIIKKELVHQFEGHGGIAPDFEMVEKWNQPNICFEGLDAQLYPMKECLVVRWRQAHPDNFYDPITVKWDKIISVQVSRRRMLDKVGHPVCTSLAREIMKQTGIPFVDSEGASRPNTGSLPIGGGTTYRLVTKNGRIEAEMQYNNFKVTPGAFRISNQTYPETVVASLAGRMLRDIIDHPLIPRDIKITSAKMENGDLKGRCAGKTVAHPDGANLEKGIQAS